MTITPAMIKKATPTTIDLWNSKTSTYAYYPAVDFHTRGYHEPVALTPTGRKNPRMFASASLAYAYAERELAKRQGKPPPVQPKPQQLITIRIPVVLHKALAAQAALRDMTMTDVISTALQWWVKESPR
jgi:hypothetical protein